MILLSHLHSGEDWVLSRGAANRLPSLPHHHHPAPLHCCRWNQTPYCGSLTKAGNTVLTPSMLCLLCVKGSPTERSETAAICSLTFLHQALWKDLVWGGARSPFVHVGSFSEAGNADPACFTFPVFMQESAWQKVPGNRVAELCAASGSPVASAGPGLGFASL